MLDWDLITPEDAFVLPSLFLLTFIFLFLVLIIIALVKRFIGGNW